MVPNHFRTQTNLVGDGGGYEMPRWLGDSRFEWPEWPEWPDPEPGTSSVL